MYNQGFMEDKCCTNGGDFAQNVFLCILILICRFGAWTRLWHYNVTFITLDWKYFLAGREVKDFGDYIMFHYLGYIMSVMLYANKQTVSGSCMYWLDGH